MSLIPAFELGVWNAWILILPQMLVLIVSDIILKRRETFESNEESTQLSKKEKKLSKITSFLFLFILFYSIMSR